MKAIRKKFYSVLNLPNPNSLARFHNQRLEKVGEVAYFLFFGLISLAKGLDLDASQKIMEYFVYLSFVFCAVKIVVTNWTFEEACSCLPLFLFGFLTYICSNRAGVFLSIIAIVGLKNISIKKLLFFTCGIRIFCFLLIVSINQTPLADYVEGFFIRYCPDYLWQGIYPSDDYIGVLGFLTKNMAGIAISIIFLILVYLLRERYSFVWFFVFECVNFLVFLRIKSATCFVVMAFFFLLAWVLRFQKMKKPIGILCTCLPFLCFSFLFLTQLLYPYVPFVSEFLDSENLLHFRIQYANDYFTYVPFTFFGADLTWYPVFLDSGILTFLFYYGMISLALYLVSTTVLLRRLVRENKSSEVAVLSATVVFGIAEQFICNVSVNVFLLLYAELIFPSMKVNQKQKMGMNFFLQNEQ